MKEVVHICGGSFMVILESGTNVENLRCRKNVKVHEVGGRLEVHVCNGIARQELMGISITPQHDEPFGWGFDKVISVLPMGSGPAHWVRDHADIPATYAA